MKIEELETKVISLKSHLLAMKQFADLSEKINFHLEVQILEAEESLAKLDFELSKAKKAEPPQ